jgi:hypothetical protein
MGEGVCVAKKRWHKPFGSEKEEKAREFETPMKGRERISHFPRQKDRLHY